MLTIPKPLSPIFWPLAVFCIGLLEYANTFGHDYAWDDKLVITDNAYTRQGIAGLPAIFSRKVSVPYKDVYRPLTQALFALEYECFPGDPHAGHVFSVLWYALLCVTVYRFIRFLFPGRPPALAGITALIYTIHPLHVEVVANIKSRDEILCFFFGIQGLILLTRWAETRKATPLVLGILCSALAVLAKENGLTLLALLPLVAFYRAAGSHRSKRLLGLPPAPALLVLSLAAAGTFYWLAHHVAATGNPNALQLNSTVLNNIFLWTTHPGDVLPTAVLNIGRYLLLFVYPHPLIHMYGYAQITVSGWDDPLVWVVLGMLLFCGLYILRHWRTRSPIVFGMIFFAVTYSIYSNLIVLAPDTMADRYMFIPSLGLALVAATGILRLAAGRSQLAAKSLPDATSSLPGMTGSRGRKWALGLIMGITLAFFCVGVAANRDWENDYTLINRRIRYMENNAAAQATYGQILFLQSMEATDPGERDSLQRSSMAAFMQAVRIYPDFSDAWLSIGKIFAQLNYFDKAELAFFRAQQLQPMNPECYFCLGSLSYTRGDLDRAVPYLQEAVALAPLGETNYLMLCRAYYKKRDSLHLALVARKAAGLFPQNNEFPQFLARASASPAPAAH